MRFLWLALSIITLIRGLVFMSEPSEALGVGDMFVTIFPPVAFLWLAYRAHCRVMAAKRDE